VVLPNVSRQNASQKQLRHEKISKYFFGDSPQENHQAVGHLPGDV
jgi:hypothetical protein